VIPSWLATGYALVVGLCVGSFLNVCIARWPHDLSVVSPRSRCPNCGHQLAWFENIPLFSWLALRARCRGCGEPISPIYPLLELAIGLLWMACFWHYGPTLLALRVAVFLTILAGVASTDLRSYLIPDGFTITGLLWSLAASLAGAFRGETVLFAGPYDALIGACAAAGLIAIIGWLGEAALKKEAMGMGDMTLMAFVGAALGPARGITTVFVGATIGAVVFLAVVYPVSLLRRGRTAPQAELPLGSEEQSTELPLVPFGVFLAPAAVVMLFWGDALLRRIMGQG
jgi:leader peptidase (prepilin peptidase) / N-methyltransferase